MAAILIQVTLDCSDPDAQARFWSHALHYEFPPPPEGFTSWESWLSEQGIPKEHWNDASAIEDPEGVGPRFYFQRVPEGKVAKNRVHLDLSVGGGRRAEPEERRAQLNGEAERLVALGARRIEWREQRGENWVVMADPEGNEFCLH